ncbi:hypothetical protein TRSC58_03455 [Trypanosoma rangeli SC58]|uniref:Uncharacterized protein n=1 Tax=Trypanosoma rangeli SC58 TaxID=429131 RepID=A0A061J3W8_TRYRA|nr:hypothetical protein TRSC58_03455 [Trypanosoma rangeli SC58]
MWGPMAAAEAEEVSALSCEETQSHHAHNTATTTACGAEYSHSSSCGDFSHIMRATHINFSHANPEASSSTATGMTRDQLSPVVDHLTKGLLAPSMGCPRCAQINGIRESLKSVEASYLREIAQLGRVVQQMDAERVDAVNRTEQTLLSLDRSRQLNLSRDCEIQSLSGQLRQIEDELQRLKYELTSLRQLYRRDVAFYHRREVLFLLENERCARAAVSSSEAGWHSALEAMYSSVLEVHQKRHCFYPSRSVETLRSPRLSEGRRFMRNGPSITSPHSLPPSITRYVDKHGGGDSGSGSVTPGKKGGLLTELWKAKETLNKLNDKLQRDLTAKEEQIASLQQQLSLRAENRAQSSQDRVDGDSFVQEMQDEIDDMLQTELFLTQMCGRHRLEADAMEERVYLLRWLHQQQQQKQHPHGLPPQTQPLYCDHRTLENQGSPELIWTPPHFLHAEENIELDVHVNGGSGSQLPCLKQPLDELCASVSGALSKTLESVLHDQLLPFKRYVESLHSSDDELRNSLKKVVQTMLQDGHDNVMHAARINERQEKFISDMQCILQEFYAANLTQAHGGLTSLREALKKVARLTSHNAKVMDDKLNDILTSQSAVARQLTLLTVPSIQRRTDASPTLRCSAAVSPSALDSGCLDASPNTLLGSKRVHAEFVDVDVAPPGHTGANAPVAVPTLPSHEWDVMDSDDESVPSLPVFSTARKTPYDVDDV